MCVCTRSLELLEKGRTTGQAARLLYDPVRREMLELEAAKAKEAEEQSKMSKKGGGKAREGAVTKMADKSKAAPEPDQSSGIHLDEEEEEEEEEEVDEAPVPSRNWYSLICYGLPNLVVVTQPSKN